MASTNALNITSPGIVLFNGTAFSAVPNSITINTTGSITGGGTISLGGTLNLNVVPSSSSFLRTFALMGG